MESNKNWMNTELSSPDTSHCHSVGYYGNIDELTTHAMLTTAMKNDPSSQDKEG